MTEISRKIEIKFGDLFCSNDRFELDMVGVFNAYEDFCNFSEMITTISNHDIDSLFISKWSFIYVKEANTLLSETIFKKHIERVKSFENSKDIFELKKEYEKWKDIYYNILSEPRNFCLHYRDMSKDGKDVLNNELLINESVNIVYSNEILEENVAVLAFYMFFMKKLGIKQCEIDERLGDELKKLGDFILLIKQLLKSLADGYLAYKYKCNQNAFNFTV